MIKKFGIAFILIATLAAGVSSSEEFKPWDLNKMIHPELKEQFIKMPEITISTKNLEALDNLRKNFVILADNCPTDDSVEVSDEVVNKDLRVRVYRPKSEAKELPALLWIHGGGHIMGLPEQDEALLLEIAKTVPCIVAAPDYDLAPEFPYPADLNDCYEALKWLTDSERSKLPVIKNKVAIAGQSAGGGLAVAVALKARDEKGPALCFQMPLYPMLDCRNITPSINQITDHRVWCKDFNLAAWEMYLGKNTREVSAYASPALAKDLSGLPPAYIMVGSLDPFRDESINYAQRLLQAGVPVELHTVPGGFHGFEGIIEDAPVSVKAVAEYVEALAKALR